MTTTPKKAPARSPRKPSTPRAKAPAERAAQIDAFEAFRSRARGVDLPAQRDPDKVTIGAEHGFDVPIVATWPSGAVAKAALDIATRSFDVGGILYILLGPQQVLRVAEKFGRVDATGADQLMAGFAIYILEKMLGPGAGDVEGGTPASST